MSGTNSSATSAPAVTSGTSAEEEVILLETKGLRRLPVQAVARIQPKTKKFYFVTIGKTDPNKTDPKRLIEMSAGEEYQVFHGKLNAKYARCRVSGMFYAGAHSTAGVGARAATANPMKNDVYVKTYWTDTARRQYGAHVLATRSGNVVVVMAKLPSAGSAWAPTSQAVISQLCPAVRIEFDYKVPKSVKTKDNEDRWDTDIGKYKLWFGLLYQAFKVGDYNNLGERYYTRYGQSHWFERWGGVFELTNGNEATLINHMAKANEITKATDNIGRFAVYVCAGAKLVLLDQYQKTVSPDGQDHNRTLVQQGGLVVVEGTLNLRAPDFGGTMFELKDLKDNSKAKCLFSTNPLPSAWPQTKASADTSDKAPKSKSDNTGTTSSSVDSLSAAKRVDDRLKKYAEYNCPVLFLAPNESEYGSIAWELDIEQQPSTGKATVPNPKHCTVANKKGAITDNSGITSAVRTCFLSIPEGGRFEAITEWKEGMDEVRARHLYERLYEANVESENNIHIFADLKNSKSGKGFQVPKEPMMKRILGIDAEDRTVYSDIHVMSPKFRSQQTRDNDKEPLPIIYDTFKCTKWVDREGKKHPFVKPDWPLIQHYNNGDNQIGFRRVKPGYMSINWGEETVANEAQPRLELYLQNADNTTRIPYERQGLPQPFDVYQYTRKSAVLDDKLDGYQAYIGIDGCYYEKDTDQSGAGQYSAVYYSPKDSSVLTADPKAPTPKPPPTGPKAPQTSSKKKSNQSQKKTKR